MEVIRNFHESVNEEMIKAERRLEDVIEAHKFEIDRVCMNCSRSIPSQNFRCCPEK